MASSQTFKSLWMLTHRGFSAWIISEGKELPEYDVVVDHNTNKVICWTPCEIGKTFSVHWMDHGTNVDSAAYIYLDGFAAPGRFLHGIGAAERSGVRVGECSERPFQFACPDPGEARSSESTPDIGTIVLRIKQVTRIADHAANAPIKPPSPPRTRHGVTEARVGYGPERTAYLQHEKTWSFVPYDKSQPGSYVQFVFRYRTREFLIEQGIIHKPTNQTEPSPTPLLFVNEQFPMTQNEEGGNYPVVDSCPSWLPPQQHWHTPPVSPTDAINPAFLTLFPPRT